MSPDLILSLMQLQVDELRFTRGQGEVVAGHRGLFLRNLAILLCRRQEACSALQVTLRSGVRTFTHSASSACPKKSAMSHEQCQCRIPIAGAAPCMSPDRGPAFEQFDVHPSHPE